MKSWRTVNWWIFSRIMKKKPNFNPPIPSHFRRVLSSFSHPPSFSLSQHLLSLPSLHQNHFQDLSSRTHGMIIIQFQGKFYFFFILFLSHPRFKLLWYFYKLNLYYVYLCFFRLFLFYGFSFSNFSFFYFSFYFFHLLFSVNFRFFGFLPFIFLLLLIFTF